VRVDKIAAADADRVAIVSQIISARREKRAVKSLVESAPIMKQRNPTKLKLPRAASFPTAY